MFEENVNNFISEYVVSFHKVKMPLYSPTDLNVIMPNLSELITNIYKKNHRSFFIHSFTVTSKVPIYYYLFSRKYFIFLVVFTLFLQFLIKHEYTVKRRVENELNVRGLSESTKSTISQIFWKLQNEKLCILTI